MKSGGIIYFDLNKKGTNGHKKHVHSMTIFGITLKRDSWVLIAIILLLLVLAALVILPHRWKDEQIARLQSGYKVYAQVPEREYVEPPLADETTQEASIRVIKKVWRGDWKVGVLIAKCESGLRPNAFNGHNTNGTWDAGLFQVNTIHGIDKETLFNAYANAGYAYAIYNEQGVQPWYSSNRCHGLLN